MGAQAGMMTSATGQKNNRQGFTLIEMIVVMAILTVVALVSAPSLSRFFRGNELLDEARQFLALTRYARAQAVSTGVPMVMWVDEQQFEYGLRPQPGFVLETDEVIGYELPETIEIVAYPLNVDTDNIHYFMYDAEGGVETQQVTMLIFQRTGQVKNQDRVVMVQSLLRPEFEIVDENDPNLAYYLQ